MPKIHDGLKWFWLYYYPLSNFTTWKSFVWIQGLRKLERGSLFLCYRKMLNLSTPVLRHCKQGEIKELFFKQLSPKKGSILTELIRLWQMCLLSSACILKIIQICSGILVWLAGCLAYDRVNTGSDGSFRKKNKFTAPSIKTEKKN